MLHLGDETVIGNQNTSPVIMGHPPTTPALASTQHPPQRHNITVEDVHSSASSDNNNSMIRSIKHLSESGL
jgi:hypothetical protein